ncbi:hypothetical protein [Burkholderia sp. 9779_493]|uniref:hypothetical protein n=1 Tax=Burkholderia sp. 9779_493 TaxID=2751184 RepID=UPI0018C38EAD|nr:hypothetical protein [Burkholderia sp. 9779_493]MBG0862629.1 hypothetical protein [Burkholderia sp. 9779_493]
MIQELTIRGNMGNFIDRVRNDEIDGPLRRKFTPAKWRKSFESAAPHDKADRRVYEAALVIHTKLENIRSRLKLSSSPALSASEKLRAYVAAANYNFLVANTKTHEAFREFGEELAATPRGRTKIEDIFSQIRLKLPGGFDYSPDEIVESIVDGIEVPIKFALTDSPDLSGNPRMAQVTWSDIVLELNLGIMFRHAEDLWDDCLWNSYFVIGSGTEKYFAPDQIDVKRGHALGIVRRMTLAANYSIIASRQHDEMIARGIQPRIRDIISVKKEGRRQVVKVSKIGDPTSDVQEELFILRGLANEPYYSDFLETPLPNLEGVTLADVLDAWVVLSRIAIVQLDGIAKKHEETTNMDVPPQTWLPGYLPVLQTDALIQALSIAADIQPAAGRLLVDFFTYRGNKGQEIWAAPLIPVGPRAVAPVFAAIVSPNLRRLVDIWMRLGGIDLEVRGPAFEQHLRNVLQTGITKSPILRTSAISIPGSYTFSPSAGRSEEIDLLFSIGSTVFIGEAKCILEPTETKGLFNHRRTVLGAAEQVRRKARCIDNNREEFIKDVNRFGIKLPNDFRIFPLIVVSTSTHVGVPADGIAVIDEYIFSKFFEGQLEHAAVGGPHLAIQKIIKDIFYTDVDDAESKASIYFNSPPQLQHLINGLCARIVPLHAIGENDWEGYILTIDCNPHQQEESKHNTPQTDQIC